MYIQWYTSICIYLFVSQDTQDNHGNLRGTDHTGDCVIVETLIGLGF